MSIDTKQLIHIAIETTVISVLFVYFYNRNKVLCEQITELEGIVAEQQETLQNHENMLINLSNSIKFLKNPCILPTTVHLPSTTVQENPTTLVLSSGSDVDDEEEQESHELNTKVEELDKNIDITNFQKADTKKKKKKKKKKSEPTEQMLDADLLEELRDLQ